MGLSVSDGIWRRFVREGTLDAGRLRTSISESWLRCRRLGVNPLDGKGREPLAADLLFSQREAQRQFLEVALPHLKALYESLAGQGLLVLLTDTNGLVLFMVGDASAMERAMNIQFVEGVRWTEEFVGTNAIGTALAVGQPLMVAGEEHFAVASHTWSCAAAPIHDSDGAVLGVVDVSGSLGLASAALLAQVVVTAISIENAWRAGEQKELLSWVMMADTALKEQTHSAVVDSKGRLVGLTRDLQKIDGEGLLQPIEEFLSQRGLTIIASHGVESSFVGHSAGKQVTLAPKAKQGPQVPVELSTFPGAVGVSAAFVQTWLDVRRVAGTEVPVLLQGETGVGKEVFARALHANSPRHSGPFVAVNCGAIPEHLLSSELFGYVEGAFTGARRGGAKGRLEQADGGTLFLDEVESMSSEMQVALLRALQERVIMPLGAGKPIMTDFRLVAATHKGLEYLVEQGKFRQDLYYRLHVYPVVIPPLRDRKEDMQGLVDFYCRQQNWPVRLPEEVIQVLMEYNWPGNVRELYGVLDYLRVRSQGATPRQEYLPPWLVAKYRSNTPGIQATGNLGTLIPVQTNSSLRVHPLEDSGTYFIPKTAVSPELGLFLPEPPGNLSFLERVQYSAMVVALYKCGGRVTDAAQMIQVARSTFYRRMHRFGLRGKMETKR